MRIEVRPLYATDLTLGFVETLSTLVPVTISEKEMIEVFRERLGVWHMFIALEEGKVIGTASVHFERKFYRDGRRVAHIEDVAVLPSHQGKGVGRLLMQKLEQVAGDKNCYKMILDCADHNVAFYERVGYRRHEGQMRKDL